jgi:integrase
MKFTKSAIAALALPAGKSDHTAWDDDLPNFGIRLRPGGSKTWTIFYRVGTKQRRESLGDCRKLELDAARKAAKQRFAAIALGLDPRAAKDKARADAAASKLTLAVVVERYLDFKEPLLRAASHEAARRYFSIHWKPLLDRPIETIRRLDVAARLQEITKQHGRVSASRARANLSSLFGWLMREGLIESNIVIGTNDPAQGLPSRERVLDAHEIRRIWHACGDDDFGTITRLLLLTAQRRNEIADARWSELDFDKATLTLPAARTKNGRQHVVPLPPAALDIFNEVRQRGAEGERIFNTLSWTNAKAKLDHKIAAEGGPLARWTLHDLRRSAATHMAELGVQPHIIEAALNHVGHKSGVAGIYNRASYEREKAAALSVWAERLYAIVEERPSKIFPLRA